MNIDQNLPFDIYRTVILGSYIKHWGLPTARRVVTNKTRGHKLEVYTFPPSAEREIFHFASIGAGYPEQSPERHHAHEYFLPIPANLGGSNTIDLENYMLDLCAHFYAKGLHGYPRVMSDSPIAPQQWTTKSMLIDEALGEDEEFSCIHVINIFHVEILWLIPIYQSEANFILNKGIEEFDKLSQASEHCIIDTNRPAFI